MSVNKNSSSLDNFTSGPVSVSVLRHVVPAIAAMLMVLVYNLADTFFIGQTHNDYMVASVNLATPVFLLFMSIGTLFGMGGTSLISRALGAGNQKRFRKSLRFSVVFALVLCSAMTLVCYVFAPQIVQAFLTETEALSLGTTFSRIMLTTAWLFGVFYVLMNALQAMGAAAPSLVISVCRQGLIYIPAVFILEAAVGMTGLAWAQPVADVLSLILDIVLYYRVRRKLSGVSSKMEVEYNAG